MPILGFGVFQMNDLAEGERAVRSAFFDHRDPAMVKTLSSYKRNI